MADRTLRGSPPGDDIDAQLPTIGLECQLCSGRLDQGRALKAVLGLSKSGRLFRLMMLGESGPIFEKDRPSCSTPCRDMDAGPVKHELKLLHAGTWALGWLVRLGLVRSLDAYAEPLLRLAFVFDRFGSSRSGFHMFLSGEGSDGKPKRVRFFMIARSGHGPYIPCMPAILLARKLARGEVDRRGATPCVDLIDLPDYLRALEGLDI